MEQPALTILNSHRIMAISTVRPDGWPQTTIVGYSNRGFDIVFMIFRASQKFSNIQNDDRISIAIADEPKELGQLKAVYAGANAMEIVDPEEREHAWRLLMERHANLAAFNVPNPGEAVFMKARCRYVSVLDFSQGIGHKEQLTIDANGVVSTADPDKDHWGLSAAAGQAKP